MPSPSREASIPSFPPPMTTQLHPPPSPGTHRALRKLQSAHNLGAKAASQPSLISQQRQQLQLQLQHQTQLQRPASPTRRNVSSSHRSPQRGRANSDAPTLQQMGAMAANKLGMSARRSNAYTATSLEKLFRDGPEEGDLSSGMEALRWKVTDVGIKSDSDGMSSLRIYIWLIFLNAPVLDTDAYLDLIHRGASPAYSKIRNDTFRTLTTDPLFRRRVSEASLIRLLNATAWMLHDAKEAAAGASAGSRHSMPHLQDTPSTTTKGSGSGSQSHTSSPAAKHRARALTLTTEGSESSLSTEPGTYVQGMNVLAAPFLYAARSEIEAFVAFHQLLTKECPGYIRGAMDGVHKGLALVDKVLAIVDPKLSLYLTSKGLKAEIYAFPSVLTLCACTPPLPEVLRLWDFLFAYGPHLNIVCIVAQLILHKTEIMNAPSPNHMLRSFPALKAEEIKRVTITTLQMIPDDVYAEIVVHAQ
ncbi:Mitotic check point protein BUB2 [Pleurostoma richardsiae]|uniref:Mitotic check point protein BUB2 n=1 Tax=Pleurostoma richardsiae TaxID=41990 RepID=A0AA38RSP5_9PEZI|nr:Mitotic check point protein BUB2 [Pleurostoma richardsiae]